jgi:hypothetical protein
MVKMAKCASEKCNRPVGGGKGSGYEDQDWAEQNGYCLPCADEGQMEIAHTNGHESIPEAECWYCHPELNEANKPYTPRTGTSRAGMVINVPIRADGVVKAAVTAGRLTGVKIEGSTVRKVQASLKAAGAKLSVDKHGAATLTVGELVLDWDFRGKFVGGTFEGKRVRNVAEALRLAV